MLKNLLIFVFILAASFCLILFFQNKISSDYQGLSKITAASSTENIIEQAENNIEESNIEKSTSVQNTLTQKQLSLEKIQEQLEDIAIQVDFLSAEIALLAVPALPKKQVAGTSTEAIEDEDKKIIIPEKLELPEKAICSIATSGLPKKDKVVINEVAWSGGTNSANDEWIEIKNLTGEAVDLAGWQLIDSDKKIKVFFEEGDVILPFSFYLLERTNDDSVPEILADKIYSGALKNDGGNLYLFDQNCRLQDAAESFFGWPGGQNDSKRTMERTRDLFWQSSQEPGGTPKKENSPGYFVISSSDNSSVVVPAKTVYPKILISEIQTESQSSSKDDFVELFNPGESDVDLSGWYLQRKTETGSDFATYASHNLFDGKTIAAKGYFLVANASSTFSAQATTSNSLTENNTLVLKNPSRDVVDMVGWGNAQDYEINPAINPTATTSIGRRWLSSTENYIDTDNNFGDFELQIATPGGQNISPFFEASTSSESTSTEPLLESETEASTTTEILSVVINEIAWMGSTSSAADEWIELYNNSGENINLAGWKILAEDGNPEINFPTSTTLIFASDFFLLEKTDDNSVKDVLADLIYSGKESLGNQGENLRLFNAAGDEIDSVFCSGGWFAGDNDTKQTMERINPANSENATSNWASSTNPGGTPKNQNSVFGTL